LKLTNKEQLMVADNKRLKIPDGPKRGIKSDSTKWQSNVEAQAFADKINRVPPVSRLVPESVASEPGSSHPPVGPFEESLTKLDDLIRGSHLAVTYLTNTLQPFLQNNVFEDSDGAKADDGTEARQTVGSSLSPTLSAVYSSLNDLDRLINRLEYLRRVVVL
jgi:hypothetical protein